MANSGTRKGAVTVTDAPTSRINLGLGDISTFSSPLSIAGGGRTSGSSLSGTSLSVFYFVGTVFSNTAINTNGKTISWSATTGLPTTNGFNASTGITVGSGVNLLPITVSAATTSTRGGYSLATNAEAVTGTDASKGIVPSSLTARLAAPAAIGTTTPAVGTFTVLELGTVGGVQFLSGSGSPSGSVTAPKGSWYLNTGSPAGLVDRAYINTDSGTTWTGITSVA